MMKVAIIGIGNMGSAIARALAKKGHELVLYGHHADKVSHAIELIKKDVPEAALTTELNAKEAVAQAEVTIVALWRHQQEAFVKEVADGGEKKIFVSIANPFDMATGGSAIPEDTSVAEELAQLLPKAIVVKAFNTAFVADYADPVFNGIEADMFVAADDEQAAQTVSNLVADAGFTPVYAGKLQMARVLEQMMILLGGIAGRNKYNWVAGWKILHR
jgi:NADPH-dependent F420 reductase